MAIIMEIIGKIHKILPERSGVSENGAWRIQSYVLDHSQYRQEFMVFDVSGDRIDRFALKEGQRVRVYFNIDAREKDGRWWNSIRAHDVRPIEENVEPPTDAEAKAAI